MIYVLSMTEMLPQNTTEINTTSRAQDEYKALSPFFLGPCELYDGHVSKNMENAWQYSKVYPSHVSTNNLPNDEYWEWAKQGWNKTWADRHPMGRGVKPLYSWWNGKSLGYVEARKSIYVPLYAKSVIKTDAYQKLQSLFESGQDMALRDFDGYNYNNFGHTLSDVLNNPQKKMGHAFVIAMLLLKDEALKECDF